MSGTPEDRISRLHPFDGLFLRAEHLDRIQAYTRELTRALGQAGGAGVVDGYDISVQGTTLIVRPGLAIDAAGRPLLLETTHRESLKDLRPEDGPIRLVEARVKEVYTGQEEVFGTICDDPCAGEAVGGHPYIAERVEIALPPHTLSRPPDRQSSYFRSRVASIYYADERARRSWLEPAGASIIRDDWSTAPPMPAGQSVVIGLLLHTEDGWIADQWIARRDRIGSPPRQGWQWRLGMRPWDVFLAQILQFQGMLSERWKLYRGESEGVMPAGVLEEGLKHTLGLLRKNQTKKPSETIEHLLSLMSGKTAVNFGVPGLVDLGIDELPPAGFLPITPGLGTADEQIGQMFPETAELRFCACDADYAVGAIEGAQYLDRIPLEERAVIDVLVPGGEWGVSETATTLVTAYNWVVFRRRRECVGDEDLVDVYILNDFARDQIAEVLKNNEERPVGTVRYPAGGWALPSDLDRQGDPTPIQRRVLTEIAGQAQVMVVGVTSSDERRPLAGMRAALIVDPFRRSGPRPEFDTVISSGLARDAIFVIISSRPRPVQREDGADAGPQPQ